MTKEQKQFTKMQIVYCKSATRLMDVMSEMLETIKPLLPLLAM